MAKEPTTGGEGMEETAVVHPAERVTAVGRAIVKVAAPRMFAWCRHQWSGLAVAVVLLVPWVLGARAATRRAEQATVRVESRLQLLEAELKAERRGAGRLRGDLARSTGQLSSVRAQLSTQSQVTPGIAPRAAR